MIHDSLYVLYAFAVNNLFGMTRYPDFIEGFPNQVKLDDFS